MSGLPSREIAAAPALFKNVKVLATDRRWNLCKKDRNGNGVMDSPERERTSHESGGVAAILHRLCDAAQDSGRVSVDDALRSFGDRGWGPLLFVPALIELTPVGSVPGVPTLIALIIVLCAAQIIMGRECMWLPGFLRRRAISKDKMEKAVAKLLPVADRLDRWFPGRFSKLTGRKFGKVAAAITILLCLTVPPLELVPFASSAPMAAIAIFGLAVALRDGLLMTLGFTLSAVAALVGPWFLLGFGGGPPVS